MPVDIQQLIIKAALSAENTISSHEAADYPGTPMLRQKLHEDVIQECVRQVMLLLEREKDR